MVWLVFSRADEFVLNGGGRILFPSVFLPTKKDYEAHLRLSEKDIAENIIASALTGRTVESHYGRPFYEKVIKKFGEPIVGALRGEFRRFHEAGAEGGAFTGHTGGFGFSLCGCPHLFDVTVRDGAIIDVSIQPGHGKGLAGGGDCAGVELLFKDVSGSDAKATCTITGGSVISVDLKNGGKGYSSNVTATIKGIEPVMAELPFLLASNSVLHNPEKLNSAFALQHAVQ
jgi:hypothetical protein